MSWIHELLLILILLVMLSVLLWILHWTRVGVFVREKIADRPRRRLFVASVSFFLTFATVRGMVFCITHNIPPFHYVIVEGRHIHHLVFGILILLLVGYGWLCEVGNGSDSSSILASRAMALLYGLGAALTLDEFALWLNLKDVYFVREGRSSIDAGHSVWFVAFYQRLGRASFLGPSLSPSRWQTGFPQTITRWSDKSQCC